MWQSLRPGTKAEKIVLDLLLEVCTLVNVTAFLLHFQPFVVPLGVLSWFLTLNSDRMVKLYMIQKYNFINLESFLVFTNFLYFLVFH